MKNLILYITFFFTVSLTHSQTLFYQDMFYGGVTANGVLGVNSTINFQVQIPINSTIKKAFLIAAVDSTPPYNCNFK